MIGHHNRAGLAARGLACARGDRTVFTGLDFELSNGGLLRISGPNGSGKTSLLRLLCGLLPPSEGSIEWNGKPVASLGEDYHGDLAYVGHLNGVKEELNVQENLAHAAKFAGLEAGAGDLAAALQEFALGDLVRLQCKFLSQGQRRRLALARLRLCMAKALWILDEPFVALDAAGVEVVRTLIEQHLAGGGLAVLTTHQEVQIRCADTRRIELAA